MRYILFCFLLIACSNQYSDIENQVISFFSQKEMVYNSNNNNYLTTDFLSLLEQMRLKEKNEIQKVKTGDQPDEKPFIIDGNIFCSFIEGYSSFSIKSVSIDNNIATVDIEFSQNQFNMHCIDKVVLIKSDKWRINNILFSQRSGILDCQTLINEYLVSKN